MRYLAIILAATAEAADSPLPARQEPVVCERVSDLPDQDRFKRVQNLLREVKYCKSAAAGKAKELVQKLQALAEPLVSGPAKAWCEGALTGRQAREELVRAAREVLLESELFFESPGGGTECDSHYCEVLGLFHGEYRARLRELTGADENFSTWLDFEFAWKEDRRKLKRLDLHDELYARGLPVPPTPCRDAYWALWLLQRELRLLSCQLENGIRELEAPTEKASGAGCRTTEKAAEPAGAAPGESAGGEKRSGSDITGIGQ